MIPHPRLRPLLALAAALLPAGEAGAQSINASYRASLAGVSVGQAQVTGAVEGASYRLRIAGTYGALGFSGTFDAAGSGAVAGGRVVPASYRATVSGRQTRTTTLAFAGGDVAEAQITPPLTPEEERSRVPINQSHRQGVVDPLGALVAQVLRASTEGDPCAGVARVFSGFSRFDLSLGAPARAGQGEVTCRATVRPVAGHRADRPVAVAGRALSVTFRDARPGTPRLPSRIEVPLNLGTLVIERAG